MESKKSYLVQFEKSEQVTEDSWRIARPSLEVSTDTKLEEVIKWALAKNNNRFPEKLEIREFDKVYKSK